MARPQSYYLQRKEWVVVAIVYQARGHCKRQNRLRQGLAGRVLEERHNFLHICGGRAPVHKTETQRHPAVESRRGKESAAGSPDAFNDGKIEPVKPFLVRLIVCRKVCRLIEKTDNA